MSMLHQRFSSTWGIGVLVSALAMSAWAQLPSGPQLGAEEIRILKIQYLKDCCYNAGGVSEESIAAVPTDKLLQYPAFRKGAEAQVPRLNQMFNRAQLTQEEIHILRGVAKAMLRTAEAASR